MPCLQDFQSLVNYCICFSDVSTSRDRASNADICFVLVQATNYVLSHQEEDSAGEIETKLIKVSLFSFCLSPVVQW